MFIKYNWKASIGSCGQEMTFILYGMGCHVGFTWRNPSKHMVKNREHLQIKTLGRVWKGLGYIYIFIHTHYSRFFFFFFFQGKCNEAATWYAIPWRCSPSPEQEWPIERDSLSQTMTTCPTPSIPWNLSLDPSHEIDWSNLGISMSIIEPRETSFLFFLFVFHQNPSKFSMKLIYMHI